MKKCIKQVDEVMFWKKANPHSNSVGNLILHLNGNITQYIYSALGEHHDVRERQIEFDNSYEFSIDELFFEHKKVLKMCIFVLIVPG